MQKLVIGYGNILTFRWTTQTGLQNNQMVESIVSKCAAHKCDGMIGFATTSSLLMVTRFMRFVKVKIRALVKAK